MGHIVDMSARNDQETALLKLAQCYRDLQYVTFSPIVLDQSTLITRRYVLWIF